MLTLYGIPSCDTCRRAGKYLDAIDATWRFHDLRADGLARDLLERWCDELGWEVLLNRRSTTWRSLDPTDRNSLDRERAIDLMLDYPTLVKRPILDAGATVKVGFDEEGYRQLAG